MRIARALFLICFAASASWAHGSTEPPPPPRDPPPSLTPNPDLPPTPPDAPPPPEGHDPTTPQDQPDTPPPPPTPIGPQPPGGTTPGPGLRPPARAPARGGARGSAENGHWRIWWEYNREHLLGLRGLLRRAGAVTGKPVTETRDPLGAERARVLATLRRTATRAGDRTLRAAALIALGRMGDTNDARLFVRLLHDRKQPADVAEGAAVGLAILESIDDAVTRDATRKYLEYAMAHASTLPARARGLAFAAAGLRGRTDARLRMHLAGLAGGKSLRSGDEAANLAFACGLAGDAIVVPELLRAVKRGRLGGQPLTDSGRSHAAHALGLAGGSSAAPLLTSLLRARSAGLDARRGAALALGRLLRETDLDAEDRARAGRELLRALDKGRDPVLRGFAAVALGGARPPLGTVELRAALDKGGNATIKPYCALALGLSARTRGDAKGEALSRFLLEELEKSHDPELGAALCIAVGLGASETALPALAERLQKRSLPAGLRGAAAQGIGLTATRDPEATVLLLDLLRGEKSTPLLDQVVLALGLLGQRSVAAELAAMIPQTSSGTVQGRLILALSHLDHSAAVPPLLKILENRKIRPGIREYAALALGILGDRRSEDVLFALDANFNFLATTFATHELIRLY